MVAANDDSLAAFFNNGLYPAGGIVGDLEHFVQVLVAGVIADSYFGPLGAGHGAGIN